MKTSLAARFFLLFLLAAGTAHADDNFWVGVKAGTLGLGIEGSWRPIPWMDVRIGANQYDYSDNGSASGINYDATLELQTYYLTANLRFPASPFRLSLGAFSNGNEVVRTGQPMESFIIGNNPNPYTPDEIGTLRSVTSFDSLAPYVGAGFDIQFANRLGLALDFGVLLQGDPMVTLTADGLLANDPGLLMDLDVERAQLANDAEDFKAYPVISLGFNFNF